jgi:hypothetical protein
MSKSKKTLKWKTQMTKLIAFSELTGYPLSDVLEEARDRYLDVEAPVYASSCSVSTRAWNKKTRSIPDTEIELWTPLWAVLQDGYDEASEGDRAAEPGDPGSLHAALQAIADEAGVSLIHTLRAAFYRFCDEHRCKFIADPHSLRYRVPTQEEEEALREVRTERQELLQKPGWCPEDDPLFHEKFRQRMMDAISGLDADIR